MPMTWKDRLDELRESRWQIPNEVLHSHHHYFLILEEILWKICERFDKEDAAKEENR